MDLICRSMVWTIRSMLGPQIMTMMTITMMMMMIVDL